MTLRILSAGAAQGVVTALAARIGVIIDAQFGAVGAIQGRFDAGAVCDLLILTRRQIDALYAQGRVRRLADLGRVRTGIAVRAAAQHPGIGSADALRAALLAAEEIYHPDANQATAGIHFAKVLAQLGISEQAAPRLRAHPNGATAMRALADSQAGTAIGCTQITEIRNTAGVALVGPLPAEFELATTYTAALCAELETAHRFFEAIVGGEAADLRATAGFET